MKTSAPTIANCNSESNFANRASFSRDAPFHCESASHVHDEAFWNKAFLRRADRQGISRRSMEQASKAAARPA